MAWKIIAGEVNPSSELGAEMRYCEISKEMLSVYFGLAVFSAYLGLEWCLDDTYAHPQNNHTTFRPTRYIHPTFCLLWCFTTATFRPYNFLLLRHISVMFTTAPFSLCNVLQLWHIDAKWMDCSSDEKIGRLVTVWHFPMAVTFCPILILIYPAFFAFKTLAWDFLHLKGLKHAVFRPL
jgi:hypothetical protein